MSGLSVILGDFCYPKSEALIIPANSKGIMSRGKAGKIIEVGLSGISKEAKAFTTNNKIELGECFSTGPGRLKRRGLKKIYHSVIKSLQSDLVSIYIIRIALTNALNAVLKDGIESVTICGLGIEPGELDEKSVAQATLEVCDKFKNKMDVKIIDDNVKFINELNNLIKE